MITKTHKSTSKSYNEAARQFQCIQHVIKNKIVFPSVLMAAHYLDNWEPANYKLDDKCEDCGGKGTEHVEEWDGYVALKCLPCAAVYARAMSGEPV